MKGILPIIWRTTSAAIQAIPGKMDCQEWKRTKEFLRKTRRRVIVKRDFKEFQYPSIAVTCRHGIASLSGRRGIREQRRSTLKNEAAPESSPSLPWVNCW
jgi:hypothetical protein